MASELNGNHEIDKVETNKQMKGEKLGEFEEIVLLCICILYDDAYGLAIVISCLGLQGMATYTAESRKKEINIRKVLGADINSLIFLLSRGFMYMLGIAICIATPLAYLANYLWLQKFAKRVSFSADFILISVGIVLLLGILHRFADMESSAVKSGQNAKS